MSNTKRVGDGLNFGCLLLAAVLLTGCAQTIQYPHFPDQAKAVEDPTKARIYLMRPGKIWGASVGLVFYGRDTEAKGPVFDPSPRAYLPWVGLAPYSSYNTNAVLRRIGELGPGGYMCWETPPHPFPVLGHSHKTNSLFTIDLEAGHVYYLRAGLRPGWFANYSKVKLLTEEEGQALLKKCNPPDAYRNDPQKHEK